MTVTPDELGATTRYLPLTAGRSDYLMTKHPDGLQAATGYLLRCRVAARKRQLQVCCARRFDRKCAYSYLQECLTANISQTTLDIDVKPAPQCAPQSKDAETCKKSKSEIFAVTGFLHPTDDMQY